MIIEDGTGRGFKQKVNKDNQAVVRAVTEQEIEHSAAEDGEAYIWTSQNLDIDAGDTLLLVKNTSELTLHLSSIFLSAGNVATRYEIHVVTVDITPAGNAVTGFNMNTGSGNVADAVAKSDETANTQGTVIYDINLLANTTFPLPAHGIILTKNISIAVDQVTESTSGNVTILGHYEE